MLPIDRARTRPRHRHRRLSCPVRPRRSARCQRPSRLDVGDDANAQGSAPPHHGETRGGVSLCATSQRSDARVTRPATKEQKQADTDFRIVTQNRQGRKCLVLTWSVASHLRVACNAALHRIRHPAENPPNSHVHPNSHFHMAKDALLSDCRRLTFWLDITDTSFHAFRLGRSPHNLRLKLNSHS